MAGAIMRFKKWRIKPSGRLPIFLRFMINSSFDHRIASKAGFKNHIINRVYLNHMMYWPAKEYDAFEREVVGYLKKNDGWIEKYCQKQLKKAEHLYKLGLKFKKIDWVKKTNKEIEKTIRDLLKNYREIACPWYAQHPIDVYYESKIEEELLKYIKGDHPDFRKFVLIFTDPKEMTEVAEEKWKLMKIAKEFKKHREKLNNLSVWAKDVINKHLNRFAYINRGLATSRAYTSKDMIGRIKQAWQDKKTLEQLIYDSSPQKLREDYQWALKQIKPRADFKKIINQARLHSYVRNRRVESFFMADHGASFVYDEVAKRSKFNPDWIMEISAPEFFDALKGKPLPSKKEMQQRFKNYAMVVKNAVTKLVVNPKEIKKLENKYFVKVDEVKEIQGRMACLGGVIRGRAKICLDKDKIGKVKKGDILVAQFTTPDFVPAMERAAAIIADQGGLSSHAAIVSRELGVPCVIATENGTRIIKDNDLLEIDARIGLIKILKRAK